MQKLTDYMRQRLTIAGWEIQRVTDTDLNVRQWILGDKSVKVWVYYADKPLTPEEIRRCFEFDGHLLFVVDAKLIPDITARETTPMWLRVLHGLYLGRVYTWNGKGINGLHFDYDQGEIEESGYISINDLQLEETGTWLKGWTGTYKLAFCGERVWWNARSEKHGRDDTYAGDSGFKSAGWQEWAERVRRKQWEDMFYGEWPPPEQPPKWKAPDPPPPEGASSSSSRQSYERARDAYWEQMRQRTGQAPDGKAFWEDEMNGKKPPRYNTGGQWSTYGTDPGFDFEYEPPKQTPPKQETPKRDLFTEFMACDSLADARRVWKKLLIENHPDKFVNESAEKIAAQEAFTKLINQAFQQAERYLK